MDTDRFMFSIKTEDVYAGLAKGATKRFDTSKHEADRHCVEIVRIRSLSGSSSSVFGLNTKCGPEKLQIQTLFSQ